MWYEFNVAKLDTRTGRHVHLFATSDRSATNRVDAKSIRDELVRAFPSPAYRIDLTRIVRSGEEMELSDLD